jgi:vacuolar-type H+-ATPase subunit E/Vma4
MAEIVAALNQYGIGLVLLAFLLLNAGKVWKTAESVFSRISPAFAERHKLAQEREEHKRKQSERDQASAIEIARDVLTTYKEELGTVRKEYRDEIKKMQDEREQLTERLFGMLGDYEQNIERVTAALISVNDSLQMLCRKVERTYERQ